MSIHDGHRERMKKRFRAEGLDSFSEIEVLELMLYYTIARRDTNVIAHELLKRFGSLSQVLEAPLEELQKVDGIGENTALYLHMVTQVGRIYMRNRAEKITVLPTLESCAEYLMPCFIGRKVEMVYLLCLDAKCKVLCCRKIAEGSVNTAGISVRKIVEQALAANASSAVLAHNHPGGLAIPSHEDVQTTIRVAEALRAVDVQLADHIVVADGDYVSMVQSGYRFEE